MLKVLKDRFIQRTDIGREYFEGSVSSMLRIIQGLLDAPNNLFEDNEGTDESQQEEATRSRNSKLCVILNASGSLQQAGPFLQKAIPLLCVTVSDC